MNCGKFSTPPSLGLSLKLPMYLGSLPRVSRAEECPGTLSAIGSIRREFGDKVPSGTYPQRGCLPFCGLGTIIMITPDISEQRSEVWKGKDLQNVCRKLFNEEWVRCGLSLRKGGGVSAAAQY